VVPRLLNQPITAPVVWEQRCYLLLRGPIRLQTRRGAIEIKVRGDRDVSENMVLMPFCYAEAAANLFKFCAIRTEMRSAAE
jgi:hypothetical protein